MEENNPNNNNENTPKDTRENREAHNRHRFKPRRTDSNHKENAQSKNNNRNRHNPHFKKNQEESKNTPHKEKTKHQKGYGNKELQASNLELRKAVELNAKVHESALVPHSRVEVNPNGKIRITPIGFS